MADRAEHRLGRRRAVRPKPRLGRAAADGGERQQMVASGLLRPEIALAWYYDLPAETEADLQAVREKYMPAAKGGEKHE